jgi:hypothetical protein
MRILSLQTRLLLLRVARGIPFSHPIRTRQNVGLTHIVSSIQYCLLSPFPLLVGLSDNSIGCDGYCLACEVFPPGSMATYYPSFNANISVNLANYGGATSLDLLVFAYCFRPPLLIVSCSTWTYWPLYCGSNLTTGSSIPIHSQVGDASFDDSFPAVNYYTFFDDGHQWDNGVYAL